MTSPNLPALRVSATSATVPPDRFQLLIEAVADYAIYMIDPDGYIVSWNTGARRFKGYEAGEIIGQHFSVFYTDEDRASGLPARALKTARQQGRYENEGWRVRKDGTTFWASVVIDPIFAPEGTLLGYAKITRDITEKMEAQKAREQSERMFSLLVQGVTDYALYMINPDGIVTNWNSGAEKIKGWRADEIIGKHFSTFYTETDRRTNEPAKALERARLEGRFEKEGLRVRKDGTTFWAHIVIDPIYDNGVLAGYAKITRDITERLKAQEALQKVQDALFQAQKMEAVGQLTGGIAHDFNNLLTIVLNNLDLAKRSLNDPRTLALIENAQTAADRGARLTQQLLMFSRRESLRPEVHSVSDLIHGFESVLRRACGEQIDFITRLRPGLHLRVDRAHFESALLNLVVNARDAMPDGGTLHIITDLIALHEREIADLAPGQYVSIIVADTGTGIAPDILGRVYEPFFTTKDIGKGTGLGLSQIYGFVIQSGGNISIESALGEGTAVKILLPALDPSEISMPSEAEKLPAPEDASGRVLIVEDDPGLQLVIVELFTTMGYETMTASDASQALAILKAEDGIDLLFSDVVMPGGMNGVDLATEARKSYPGLKILLASGYPQKALVGKTLDENMGFISKPYRWSEIAERLRNFGL